VQVLSFRPRAGRIEGKAYVDGKLACEATLTCQVVPRERKTPATDAEAAPVEANPSPTAGTDATGQAEESAE
jgi:3-hydroxyacyl-[acyl-carrier-protein] dehydratase